ncbi:OmpA family protein [Polaribacter sp. WD7]|uniref:OmpA family protein n=1 Tax=Polaribacter sp. WD7 TaxID=2269061 RepID=UPI000DF4C1E7|nr:OmpA family protein [Polaribacter sp. WD7]RCS27783.1 OmpA family protein [Polaribacter sp. WD7]
MKYLKLLFSVVFFLTTVFHINAQDENNPWVVGFGVNSVDIYSNPDDFTDQLKDLLGNSDWNILPAISRISVDRYIKNGFSVQLAGSLNEITTVQAENDSDFFYWAVDAIAKYDLNYLFGETGWFDPYVYLGGGYTSLDGVGEVLLNGGVGFNIWINEKLGINFQHGTKAGFADKVNAHYQNALGLVIRFGAKDSDGDGISDKLDECPNVPGLKVFKGCPDSDGDGIKDSDDACPNVAGLAAMNGCPDSDGDGIADNNDMCPNAKGTKANKGCPDADGDGVLDKNDKCVSVAGPSANTGCPWPDTDGDGVLDKDDKCPNKAGVASEMGCPAGGKLGDANAEDFENEVYFEFDKKIFKPGSTKKLDEIVKAMKENKNVILLLEGHTDSIGTETYNYDLSKDRANTVRDYMIRKGIDSSRLQSKYFGETKPVATNTTAKGRKENRRVEIKLSLN